MMQDQVVVFVYDNINFRQWHLAVSNPSLLCV
jgi:hypothetical protein